MNKRKCTLIKWKCKVWKKDSFNRLVLVITTYQMEKKKLYTWQNCTRLSSQECDNLLLFLPQKDLGFSEHCPSLFKFPSKRDEEKRS